MTDIVIFVLLFFIMILVIVITSEVIAKKLDNIFKAKQSIKLDKNAIRHNERYQCIHILRGLAKEHQFDMSYEAAIYDAIQKLEEDEIDGLK